MLTRQQESEEEEEEEREEDEVAPLFEKCGGNSPSIDRYLRIYLRICDCVCVC